MIINLGFFENKSDLEYFDLWFTTNLAPKNSLSLLKSEFCDFTYVSFNALL